MTAQDIRDTLAKAYPGVDFSVRKGSYGRGTNSGQPIFEVRYNFKRFPIAPERVQAFLPKNASLWAYGRT